MNLVIRFVEPPPVFSFNSLRILLQASFSSVFSHTTRSGIELLQQFPHQSTDLTSWLAHQRKGLRRLPPTGSSDH